MARDVSLPAKSHSELKASIGSVGSVGSFYRYKDRASDPKRQSKADRALPVRTPILPGNAWSAPMTDQAQRRN